LLEFEHTKYSHLQQKYSIPKRIRTGKELMDYSKKNPSVLRKYRCLPISRYYSMLLENTPGYEKNTSSSADRENTPRSGRNEPRSDQDNKMRSDQNITPQSDQCEKKRPFQVQQALFTRGKEQSFPAMHKSMQHRAAERQGSSPSVDATGMRSSGNSRPQSTNVDHHDRDQ
jgi:hypothetical protein